MWPMLLRILFVAVFVGVLGGDSLTPGQDAEAKVVSAPDFRLSEEAVKAGIAGRVAATLSVDKSGSVSEVVIHGGPAYPCGSGRAPVDEVRKGIRDTLLAAKFSPAMKGGKPVATELSIMYDAGSFYRPQTPAAPDSPAAVKVIQGGVINGKAKSLPKPAYPPAAHASRASGTVTVELLVDEHGKVAAAGALAGHPLLHDAARDAACSAKFSPTTLNGQPVRVTGTLIYNFVP